MDQNRICDVSVQGVGLACRYYSPTCLFFARKIHWDKWDCRSPLHHPPDVGHTRVLLLGASKGVGHAFAISLFEEGALVTMNRSNMDRANEAARTIAAQTGEIDITARSIQRFLTDTFGQQGVIKNHGGAKGKSGIKTVTPAGHVGYIVLTANAPATILIEYEDCGVLHLMTWPSSVCSGVIRSCCWQRPAPGGHRCMI
jgi:hypothetical protein